MACGFGPQMFEMIEKMRKEEEDKLKKKENPDETLKQKIETQQAAQATEKDAEPGDWTSTYRKWDQWEDLEELNAQAAEEAARAERAAAGRTACSHDHSAERAIADLSTAAQLAAMRRFRAVGNLLWDEGQYLRAAVQYKRALIHYDYCFPEGAAEQAAADALRAAALRNSAAAFLRARNAPQALELLYQALTMDPNDCKALYQKAQALRMLDRFSEAKECLARALALRPDDPDLRRERRLLQSKITGYKNRSHEMGQRIFTQQQIQSSKQHDVDKGNGSKLTFEMDFQRRNTEEMDRRKDEDDLYAPMQFTKWDYLKSQMIEKKLVVF